MFCTLFIPCYPKGSVTSKQAAHCCCCCCTCCCCCCCTRTCCSHTCACGQWGRELWGGVVGWWAESRGQRVDRLSSRPGPTCPWLHRQQLQLQWLLQQAVPHSHCSTAPLSAAAAVGVPCSPSLLAGVCAHTVGCFIRSFIQTSCYYYSSHIALFVLRPRIL